MAYTICDEYGYPLPIRILMPRPDETIKIGEQFTPYWWVCDPCNPSSRRFEITYRADQEQPTPFHWYEIVTSDDDEDDIRLKVKHYERVIQARKAMEEARREWERLNA